VPATPKNGTVAKTMPVNASLGDIFIIVQQRGYEEPGQLRASYFRRIRLRV